MMGKGIRMNKHKNRPKCPPIVKRLFLKKDTGVVLLVTLLLMLGIAVLGVGVVVNANLNASVAKNYVGKLQSFYAADAQVAEIAQEVFDGNADKWLGGTAVHCGSPNIVQNCGFSNSGTWQVISQFCGACSWACGGCTFTDTVANGKTLGHLSVTNGGDSACSAEFGQAGLTLTQGVTYRVSFTICSPESLYFADVNMQGGNSPWPLYTGNRYFYPGAALRTISYAFKMDSATDNNAGIWFQCGGQGPLDLFADNVTVIPISNATYNLALGATAWASGYQTSSPGPFPPANAIDGDAMNTRWGSPFPGSTPNVSASVADTQWIAVDLGKVKMVNEVLLKWENAYGAQYEIDVSTDKNTWYQVAQIVDGKRESRDITFAPQDVRYVRMKGIQRGTVYGYSIYEFEVYGSNGGRDTTGKTCFGGDSISWELKEVIPTAGFSIFDTACSMFGVNKKTFNSQLAQYVELPTGGLVDPYGVIAKIPVTYYDFHSDRSNPEFEQPHCGGNCGPAKGMVATTLDGSRKPVWAADIKLNHNIAKWFRPWVPNVVANDTIPVYKYRWGFEGGQYDANEYSRCPNPYLHDSVYYDNAKGKWNDTSFKDSVIPDFLPLTHIGNGMYQYINGSFYILDGRGFGNEWNESGANHNYSFTMQLSATFTKVPGQIFFFAGDDDVWVFINNHLVMDLGGQHQKLQQVVNVDTVSGLVNGMTYNFDFFYCERHSTSAEIEVMTNLLTYHTFTQQQVQWKRSYGNIN
jgi:fibro-slime domain-containing protein